mmetsp:Transcript_20924/g.65061  ORF Transcript_20924/g.65061 Transcript_20924/m.65061 type:complete len:394 (-) Transcript_20924:24-1205(-)
MFSPWLDAAASVSTRSYVARAAATSSHCSSVNTALNADRRSSCAAPTTYSHSSSAPFGWPAAPWVSAGASPPSRWPSALFAAGRSISATAVGFAVPPHPSSSTRSTYRATIGAPVISLTVRCDAITALFVEPVVVVVVLFGTAARPWLRAYRSSTAACVTHGPTTDSAFSVALPTLPTAHRPVATPHDTASWLSAAKASTVLSAAAAARLACDTHGRAALNVASTRSPWNVTTPCSARTARSTCSTSSDTSPATTDSACDPPSPEVAACRPTRLPHSTLTLRIVTLAAPAAAPTADRIRSVEPDKPIAEDSRRRAETLPLVCDASSLRVPRREAAAALGEVPGDSREKEREPMSRSSSRREAPIFAASRCSRRASSTDCGTKLRMCRSSAFIA